MASESTTTDVMLSGQSGYMKKQGTMTNFGIIHVDDSNTNISYGPGFIDENSKIDKFEFETSADYKSAEVVMKVVMGEHWTEIIPEDSKAQSVLEQNAINLYNEISQNYERLTDIVEVN